MSPVFLPKTYESCTGSQLRARVPHTPSLCTRPVLLAFPSASAAATAPTKGRPLTCVPDARAGCTYTQLMNSFKPSLARCLQTRAFFSLELPPPRPGLQSNFYLPFKTHLGATSSRQALLESPGEAALSLASSERASRS